VSGLAETVSPSPSLGPFVVQLKRRQVATRTALIRKPTPPPGDEVVEAARPSRPAAPLRRSDASDGSIEGVAPMSPVVFPGRPEDAGQDEARWTPEEDTVLREAVALWGDWHEIAAKIRLSTPRTEVALRQRYNVLGPKLER
jgi:hypothetical protein